jgi:restriction system protein
MAEITARRQGELLAGVFQVLQKYPDGLAAKDVLRQVSEIVPPTPFEAADYPNRPGDRRYEKIIRFSTIPFVRAGWLVKTKGTWTATEQGLAAFDKVGSNAESWFRAADSLYRKWKKDQPERNAVPDVDEAEIEEETAVRTTFEEATEAAFADIRAHVEAMSPYDFQDLVAALLEAMGYRVLWVAPPGPDRGVDIVAGSDPLGVQEPRIKVQVKHRFTSATDVSDLRAFMAVLGSRDVGIFVSAGGFTKAARDEARNHETRRLTLLDLEQLLDLWISHYGKITEDRKLMLPLRPVYYLAPY